MHCYSIAIAIELLCVMQSQCFLHQIRVHIFHHDPYLTPPQTDPKKKRNLNNPGPGCIPPPSKVKISSVHNPADK